jgi:hypothetical protein
MLFHKRIFGQQLAVLIIEVDCAEFVDKYRMKERNT